MSLSDRFKSFVNKKPDSSAFQPEKPEIAATAETKLGSPTPSHTLEELSKLITQERTEGETKKQALEKELHEIRASLEKMDITAKSSRDSQHQTLQFLQ